MNPRIALFSLLLVPISGVAQRKAAFEAAVSPVELTAMMRTLPSSPIYSVKLFREGSKPHLSMAVLSSSRRNGWKVSVISRSSRGYQVSWSTPKLDQSFAVSDPKELGTYGLEGGEAVVFSGCAPHMCPDIFSVLLYVPSRREYFTATCNQGGTSYTTSNADYKASLNELLRKQTGSKASCSSEVQGER